MTFTNFRGFKTNVFNVGDSIRYCPVANPLSRNAFIYRYGVIKDIKDGIPYISWESPLNTNPRKASARMMLLMEPAQR